MNPGLELALWMGMGSGTKAPTDALVTMEVGPVEVKWGQLRVLDGSQLLIVQKSLTCIDIPSNTRQTSACGFRDDVRGRGQYTYPIVFPP